MSAPCSHQFAVIAVTGRITHVIDHNSVSTKHTLIQTQNQVLTATASASSVIIATCDDKLWEVPGSALGSVHNLKQHSGKPDRHGQKEEEMDVDDIFGDLLKDECSIKEGDNTLVSDFQNPVNSNRVFRVTSEYLLHSMENTIIDIAAVANILAVLADEEGLVMIHIFRCLEHDFAKTLKDSYRKDHIQNIFTDLRSSMLEETMSQRTRCLFFVLPDSQNHLNSSSSASVSKTSTTHASLPTVMSISEVLFVSVFGKEAGCLNSPVLMISCGQCVFACAVKSVKHASKNRLKIICQMNSNIKGILSVKVWVEGKKSDHDDVLAALSAAVGKETPGDTRDGLKSGLAVLSVTGETILFMSLESTGSPTVLKFSLPHHISSCIAFKEYLVYATDKSVELCRLTLLKRSDDDSVSVTPVLQTLLKKARIRELLPFSVMEETEDNTITGITQASEVIPIRVSWNEGVNSDCSEVTSSHSLNDIHHRIEEDYAKLKSVKEKSSKMDSFLQQINIFASLAQVFKVRDYPDSVKSRCSFIMDPAETYFKCHCGVSAVQNGYSHNWNLIVKVKNTTETSLSEDWTIVVTVCSAECDIPGSAQNGFNKSYSYPLSKGLKPLIDFELCIPLDDVINIHSAVGMDVSVSLVLKLNNLHNMLTGYSFLPKAQTMTIHKQQFDILYFLHGMDDHCYQQDRDVSHHGQSSNLLHLDNELRKMVCNRLGGNALLPEKHENLTTRIGVLKSVCEALNLHSPTDVLLYLLRHTSIPAGAINSPTCRLQDPHNSVVTLAVGTVIPDVTKSKPPAMFEYQFVVTLRGSSSSVFLQTYAAVKSRITPDEGAQQSQSRPMSITELRRHLAELQKMKENIQSTQDKLESLDVHEGESGKFLCELMEKRELLPKAK